MYISVRKIAIMGCEYCLSGALKTKGHQADNPVVTGSTVSCNDNARYHQRRQRCQNDDPRCQLEKKNTMIIWQTTYLKYHVNFSHVDITLNSGANIC